MNDFSKLRVGDQLVIEGSALSVLEVVYPLQPATGRGLYRVQKAHVGLSYALKVFDLANSGNDRAAVGAEVVALNRTLNYPEHFPKAHAWEVRGSWALLLLDWMEGKPLSRCCEALPRGESDVRLRVGLLGQLARVLSFLHRTRLLHRDLKPDNVLLRNPNDAAAGIALIDFGLSNERRTQEEGSLGFRAPEQYIARELNLSAAADIFALGQIGHWLLTGAPAALDRDLLTPAWEPNSAASLNDDARLPLSVRPILKAALSYKPEQRPRASDLASALLRLRDFGGKR